MSHRLKILHIISSWESGVSNELAAFASRLPREDFASEICILSGSQARNVDNVPITTLNRRWSLDVGTYFGIARLIRRFRPDVVHTWDAAARQYGILHPGNHRVIAEKRDADLPPSRWQQYLDSKTHRLIVPHKRYLSPKAIGPQTVSIAPAAVPVPEAEPIPAESFLEQLGFAPVEPSGDYYPVFQSQYDPARRNYKPRPLSPTPFLIGVVLPLRSEYHIMDALWVFETLRFVHLNFHAFIIGDGKDRESFLRYRDRWKLFSRVHFLGNCRDTLRLLPHFDVLLHLSPSAEYSGAILSAMSCGVPVIALETPESREYLSDGESGMLIPAEGDYRFYRRTAAKKLLHLLENEELRRSMSRAAKERAKNEFDFNMAVQRRIDEYRNVRMSNSSRPFPPAG